MIAFAILGSLLVLTNDGVERVSVCRSVMPDKSNSPLGDSSSPPELPIPIPKGSIVPNLSVDLTTKVHDLPPSPVSTTVSTYGTPITSDINSRTIFGKIAKGEVVRIPLQWNGGNPCSSAGGGPRNISGDDWIKAITSVGAKAMIVIGGSNDNNFSASDAANLAKRYKDSLYAVVIGNEADNGGMSMGDYITKVFRPAAQAIRTAVPGLKIAGPAETSFKPGDLQSFISQCKGLFDIIDYHHYGTGQNAPNDSTLMGQTGAWENEVNSIRGWLNSSGLSNVEIQVGEYNLAWQFNDGIQGGDQRFFSAYNTAWSASVIGHILKAGGRSLAYSQQNGPLGIMVEAGNQDKGHPGGTPMPIYWGIGQYQGAGNFPDFGKAIMASGSDSTSVECYAGSSGNVVVVNKSSSSQTAYLTIKGSTDGGKTVWSSNTSSPYSGPNKTTVSLSGGKLTLSLQPYQVATVLTGATVVVPPVDPPVDPPVVPPVTPPTGVGLPVVKNGSTGPVALAVQKLLLLNGYTQQGLNSSFGYSSEANVRDFQTKKGLTSNGIVDQSTYIALIMSL